METSLVWFWIIFCIWILVRSVYRIVIRPFFSDKARFEFFAIRDRLRELERDVRPGNDAAFRYLESSLNSAINSVDRISVGAFFAFLLVEKNHKQLEKSWKEELASFHSSAIPEIRKLDDEFTSVLSRALRLNSPIFGSMIFVLRGVLSIFTGGRDPADRTVTVTKGLIHSKHSPARLAA